MIYEPELETLSREDMTALQSRRLRDMCRYVYERVEFYRARFDEVIVGEVESVEDLVRLPITRKQDLRDNYPFGLFAVPRRAVSRLHASSGTTGKPTVVGYTKQDIDVFAQVNARCLAMGGGAPGLMLHNAYGYGLFTGGLGLHYGGELLGMTVVPVSGGMTERQLVLIADFRPEVICCTPSYALTLVQEVRRRGLAPDEISLKFAVLGAEPWSETMRREIDAGLGVCATNIFGLSEIIGPGVSSECVEVRDGSHINEDHFLAEVVDPNTEERVDDGQEGVLLITTLTKQALPLVRYWTGDITSLRREPCGCGRTLTRMALIKGRTDDMLIIRGVNLYPMEVERVLGRFEELSPHHRLVVTRGGTLDELAIQVEVTEAVAARVGLDRLEAEGAVIDGSMTALRERVESSVKDSCGVAATVELVAPGSLPRSEGGKLNRVDDRRTL
jgi:phenylacetate-CoA ligase